MRMDVVMAGLMTVLVVETRKRTVIKEMGELPAYDSLVHFTTPPVESGDDSIFQ